MKNTRRIIEQLRQSGHTAYLVGGCVRDSLLHLPVKDDDIATSAPPDQILNLFPDAKRVGAHFGVVIVDGVEVATYRSDGAYQDGRHPEQVHFETDPRKDASRRDFTINGMFLDPMNGEVLDFVGGREDLAAGIIRAIGDPSQRFQEDHLRMLRAVRFAARLGFSIEPETLEAIRKLAPSVRFIAAERIRGELTRMLTEGAPRRALELLDESQLLKEVLPEVKAFQGVEQPPEYHPEGDVWTHVLIMLEMLENPSPTLAWGVLLHDVGKPGTFQRLDRIRFNGHVELGVTIARDILSRYRFSNEDREQILSLIANHMRFADVQRMKQSTLKRFFRLPSFEEHLELHRVDCSSSHNKLDNYGFAKREYEALPPEEIRPQRLLSGSDLIEMGWKPGSMFKDILNAVEDAQLEGKIQTRQEALELALSLRPQDAK